jgi:hypothetical protein
MPAEDRTQEVWSRRAMELAVVEAPAELGRAGTTIPTALIVSDTAAAIYAAALRIRWRIT